ncbi:MerR family DNA-binding transcriptional regulator [Sphingomonas naphthae]|uniref:MerR family DNA-binding transcriptional regulator n=1 Tax=Sphingomonas naphthae TaxID=1813468 RepID=A0ABY7TQA3_9SPHN|nr:MerR family DNA-binding transcriptional regulator [Sphingomonas naphthae]WCT75313.1 MerR family DNA-binding transcriptional regulator [Sphingomonas naphthae]
MIVADGALHGIQEVATTLGLTHRTLRFYEDRGLVAPQRVGSTRVYTKRDVARLQLIQRGKRLGFSIREIKDFLDLYDADPEHIEQARLLLAGVEKRAADLHKQRDALDETITELEQLQREVRAWIEGH